jgi:endonuclease YncB( thermonuclease family)
MPGLMIFEFHNRMKAIQFYFVFLLFGSVTSSAADIIMARVVSVVDGNTIEIQTEGTSKRLVVIAGIDCPELTQEFGNEARQYVEDLILQKQITVKVVGKDRKGNYIGVVLIGENDLRMQLLQEGLAWTSEREPAAELESVRVSAQQQSKGLWKSEMPIAPWVHRRQQSMMQPKSSS